VLSDTQRESISAVFDALDASGDGLITHADAMLRADQLSDGFELDEASPARRDIQAAYRQLWDELLRFADTDDDGAVDVEEFIDALDRGMLEDPGFIDSAMLVVTEALFTGADANGDGMIDVEEYSRMLLTVDPTTDELARAGFAIMDTDHDGAISRAELVAAMRAVFYGDTSDELGARLVR
jgi:Ca2+-binding EF-hand superfamily protein